VYTHLTPTVSEATRHIHDIEIAIWIFELSQLLYVTVSICPTHASLAVLAFAILPNIEYAIPWCICESVNWSLSDIISPFLQTSFDKAPNIVSFN
jgi:hypothetical protein